MLGSSSTFVKLRSAAPLCIASSSRAHPRNGSQLMEGKFAGGGLQSIDEDEDMLSARARELVQRSGIRETADAVWKPLNAEHQKLYPATSRCADAASSIEMSGILPDTDAPANLVQGAMSTGPVFVFGQRPQSLSSRKRRGQPVVPEQASLFGLS